jgi:hypothetical protein
MGGIVMSLDLLERLSLITAIESASFNGSLFILEVAEDIHEEFMAVMLLDGVELLGNKFFQFSRIHNPLLQSEDGFVIEVEGVTETEVISLCLDTFVRSIVLLQEMVPHLFNRHQALETSIHVAVETVVPHSCNALSGDLTVHWSKLGLYFDLRRLKGPLGLTLNFVLFLF